MDSVHFASRIELRSRLMLPSQPLSIKEKQLLTVDRDEPSRFNSGKLDLNSLPTMVRFTAYLKQLLRADGRQQLLVLNCHLVIQRAEKSSRQLVLGTSHKKVARNSPDHAVEKVRVCYLLIQPSAHRRACPERASRIPLRAVVDKSGRICASLVSCVGGALRRAKHRRTAHM